MPVRKAEARWEGDLPSGKGTMRFGGGAFEGQYSFSSRFEDGPGTNPEELIAAAHAGCFTMKMAFDLGAAGFTPDSLETGAEVTLDNGTITTSKLTLKAKVPGISKEKFDEVPAGAKANCPVSKVLNADISLDATLL